MEQPKLESSRTGSRHGKYRRKKLDVKELHRELRAKKNTQTHTVDCNFLQAWSANTEDILGTGTRAEYARSVVPSRSSGNCSDYNFDQDIVHLQKNYGNAPRIFDSTAIKLITGEQRSKIIKQEAEQMLKERETPIEFDNVDTFSRSVNPDMIKLTTREQRAKTLEQAIENMSKGIDPEIFSGVQTQSYDGSNIGYKCIYDDFDDFEVFQSQNLDQEDDQDQEDAQDQEDDQDQEDAQDQEDDQDQEDAQDHSNKIITLDPSDQSNFMYSSTIYGSIPRKFQGFQYVKNTLDASYGLEHTLHSESEQNGQDENLLAKSLDLLKSLGIQIPQSQTQGISAIQTNEGSVQMASEGEARRVANYNMYIDDIYEQYETQWEAYGKQQIKSLSRSFILRDFYYTDSTIRGIIESDSRSRNPDVAESLAEFLVDIFGKFESRNIEDKTAFRQVFTLVYDHLTRDASDRSKDKILLDCLKAALSRKQNNLWLLKILIKTGWVFPKEIVEEEVKKGTRSSAFIQVLHSGAKMNNTPPKELRQEEQEPPVVTGAQSVAEFFGNREHVSPHSEATKSTHVMFNMRWSTGSIKLDISQGHTTVTEVNGQYMLNVEL